MGAELFHKDERTNKETDMTKIIVTFCSFANTPKTEEIKYTKINPGKSFKLKKAILTRENRQ